MPLSRGRRLRIAAQTTARGGPTTNLLTYLAVLAPRRSCGTSTRGDARRIADFGGGLRRAAASRSRPCFSASWRAAAAAYSARP